MLPQVLVDVLTVVWMFVLRIGVPLAITLAFGYWLEKKLAPPEQAEETLQRSAMPRPAAKSAKVIQLHCWHVKRCDPARRVQCPAFQRSDLPCWLALQAAGEKVRAECFTCAFYKPQTAAA